MMQRIAEQQVFQFGTDTFSWGDVFLAAFHSGAFDVLEQDIASGIAAQQSLSEDELAPLAEEWLTAFRYERNLLTVEETELWLATRQLSTDELFDCAYRIAARTKSGNSPPQTHRTEIVKSHILAEGFCSGRFDAFAEELALALSVCENDISAPLSQTRMQEIKAFASFYGISIDNPARAALITHVRSGLDHFLKQDLEQSVVRRLIETDFVGLTRVDFGVVSFSNSGSAAEALLCVRSDDRDLGDLARELGITCRRYRHFISELSKLFDPALAVSLASAAPGDLLGPFTTDRETLVVQVDERLIPDYCDQGLISIVRTRARLEEASRRATDKIRWLPSGNVYRGCEHA